MTEGLVGVTREVSGCDWSQQGLNCTCRFIDEEYVCLTFCSMWQNCMWQLYTCIYPVEAGHCVGHLCRSYCSQSMQARDATVSINSLTLSHTASTYIRVYLWHC